jgi:hypothetical protein
MGFKGDVTSIDFVLHCTWPMLQCCNLSIKRSTLDLNYIRRMQMGLDFHEMFTKFTKVDVSKMETFLASK